MIMFELTIFLSNWEMPVLWITCSSQSGILLEVVLLQSLFHNKISICFELQ